MADLKCGVTNCGYNKDSCCCKGDICVGGERAENADSIRAYIDLSTEASKASGCFDIYSRPEKVIPAKTGVGNGIDAYDLTFAKAAYKLWNDILPYPSTAVCARSRYSLAISSQYMSSAENHAKMQFYTYVSQIADPADRTAVARAVMGK